MNYANEAEAFFFIGIIICIKSTAGGQREKLVLNQGHFTADMCCFRKQSDDVAMPVAQTHTQKSTHTNTTRAAAVCPSMVGKYPSVPSECGKKRG